MRKTQEGRRCCRRGRNEHRERGENGKVGSTVWGMVWGESGDGGRGELFLSPVFAYVTY